MRHSVGVDVAVDAGVAVMGGALQTVRSRDAIEALKSPAPPSMQSTSTTAYLA